MTTTINSISSSLASGFPECPVCIEIHVNCNPDVHECSGGMMELFLMRIAPDMNTHLRVTNWNIHKRVDGILRDYELNQFLKITGITGVPIFPGEISNNYRKQSTYSSSITAAVNQTAQLNVSRRRVRTLLEQYHGMKLVEKFRRFLALIDQAPEGEVKLLLTVDLPFEKLKCRDSDSGNDKVKMETPEKYDSLSQEEQFDWLFDYGSTNAANGRRGQDATC